MDRFSEGEGGYKMREQFAKATAQAIKEITLKDIYDAIGQVKQRQEEDFRYLNQRIDSLGQKIDTEVGQIRQEMGQLRQEMGQFRQEISSRLDNITQLLVQMLKK